MEPQDMFDTINRICFSEEWKNGKEKFCLVLEKKANIKKKKKALSKWKIK